MTSNYEMIKKIGSTVAGTAIVFLGLGLSDLLSQGKGKAFGCGGCGGCGSCGTPDPPFSTTAPGASGGCEGDCCDNATTYTTCDDPGPCPDPHTGDPVYIKTGEFIWDTTDVAITGKKLSVEIKRNYGSRRATEVGPFGYGWDFNYDKHIEEGNPLTAIRFQDGAGSVRDYDLVSGSSPPKYTRVDTREYFIYTDGTYKLIKTDGTVYAFNSNKLLSTITDKFNNKVTIGYDGYTRVNTITDDLGHQQLTFTYSGPRVRYVDDFAGRRWTYSYDPNRDLISVKTPSTSDYQDGLTSKYAYDTSHRLVSLVDPNDNEIFHSYYDAQGRVYMQYHDNALFDFDYDSSGSKLTTTDREGYTIKQTHNADGQPLTETVYTENPNDDPNHFTTTYTYTSQNRQERIVYPASNCVDYTYDSSGRRTGEYRKTDTSQPNDRSDPDVLATTYTYDTTWPDKIKTVTAPDGNVITYDYNSTNGSLEKITYPTIATINGNQAPIVTFTYDPNGRLETAKDPNGMITKYEYYTTPSDVNNYGHLKKVIVDSNTAGLNIATQFSYDKAGHVIEITDPNSAVTKRKYNNLDQLEQTTTPSPYSNVTKFSYDDKKGKTKKIENVRTGGNQITKFSYDFYGNILTETDPLNHITNYGYNKNKDVNSITDAENNKTQLVRNERHLIVTSTDPNGDSTTYRYNSNGKLYQIQDANSNVTQYDYDGFDRLTKITYPDATYEQFGYDKNSNVTSKRNRAGDTIYYQYNALAWMTKKTRPSESAITYAYDKAERLKTVTQSSTTLASYSYDRVSRVTNVTNADSRQVSYQYNSRGLRTRLNYPDNTSNNSYVTYEYDTLGRLSKVNYNGSMVASYIYDQLGRRTQLSYSGTNHQVSYTYDLADRLTELDNKLNGSQTQVIQYSQYDNVGNRKNMVVDSATNSYTYNKKYELTFADYPSVWTDTTYKYDKVGNRTSTIAGSTTTYLHGKLNQYSKVGTTNYSYDTKGNLTNDGTYQYIYDCENRLTEVRNGGGSTIATYQYDDKGRRIAKTVSGTTTKYVYDDDNLIAEYDGSTLLRKYVFGPNIDEPVCMVTSGGTQYFYYFDGLGSVVRITDTSGTVKDSYSYDVFGAPSAASNINNRFMFTGREYDSETGNYYYRARYYKPSIGRFLQPDPIGYEDGVNLYTYVSNNPTSETDPAGLKPKPKPKPKPPEDCLKGCERIHNGMNVFGGCEEHCSSKGGTAVAACKIAGDTGGKRCVRECVTSEDMYDPKPPAKYAAGRDAVYMACDACKE